MNDDMMASVYATQDILEITDLLSSTLGKPVIIESADFRLISYSSIKMEHFDQANQQTILSKKSPDLILNRFLQDGVLKQLKSSLQPFRIRSIAEIGLNQRVVATVRYNSEIMGYIWIQEIGDPLSELDMQHINEVASHAGRVIYEKDQSERDKRRAVDLLYWKWIQDPGDDVKMIRKEAEAVHVVLPQRFTVMVLKFVSKDNRRFEEVVRSKLVKMKNGSYVLVTPPHYIIIAGSAVKEDNAAFRMMNDMVAHIPEEVQRHLLFGLGNTYSDIRLVRKSYLEAMEVIKSAEFIGRPQSTPVQFCKLGVYRYLEVIATTNYKQSYQNADLEKLVKHDAEHHSELIKTLKFYLEHDCKLKQTAEALFIHPNSLNYRIKQISSLIPLDLHDMNLKSQLYIELILIQREAK